MSKLSISEELIEKDDRESLSALLDRLDSPEIGALLDLLSQLAEKPHTTLCLLNYLHAHFSEEEIRAERERQLQKDLGSLDLEEEDFTELYRWEENEDGIRILAYLGQDEDVLIPEEIGRPVTEISRLFFADSSPMETLLVPEGIRIGTVRPAEAAGLFGRSLLRPSIVRIERETGALPAAPEIDRPLPGPGLLQPGCEICFGRYTRMGSGEEEPLRWRVLQADERAALLLAASVLEKLPYHSRRTAVFWESCELSRWLNEDFADAAFTDEEKACLLTQTHAGEVNPLFHTRKNPVSSDKVFLLSPSEWEACPFPEGTYPCSVWLRMPGLTTQYAVTCGKDGSISWQGNLVNDKNTGIVPAIRIRLAPSEEKGGRHDRGNEADGS